MVKGLLLQHNIIAFAKQRNGTLFISVQQMR